MIFPLSEGQYKTIELILNDPSTLEDSSRNLRTILYGPTEEFEVPCKQLYLNKTSQSLVVTDTEANVRRVEAFLEDMPQLIGDQRPLETRVYQVDKDIARDVYEILKLVLFEGRDRVICVTPVGCCSRTGLNSLIVRDYPENIDQVEQILLISKSRVVWKRANCRHVSSRLPMWMMSRTLRKHRHGGMNSSAIAEAA